MGSGAGAAAGLSSRSSLRISSFGEISGSLSARQQRRRHPCASVEASMISIDASPSLRSSSGSRRGSLGGTFLARASLRLLFGLLGLL
jgi:hypothetical protein